jgi:hypothetical protein
MIVGETDKCIRCLRKKAIMHIGHVLLGKDHILAGWCGRCLQWERKGFFGRYTDDMGMRKPVTK